MKGVEALLLDLREGALGNDVPDLEVVDAVDEDDEAAVVDVTECVFWVVGLASDAEPENVDRYSVVDKWKVGGFARDWVAAVASYGENCRDFDGAVGSIGADTGDGSVRLLDQASGLPTHTQCEGREARGFGGEEVEEVPLRHEGDEFGVCRKVREVGHGDGVSPEVTRELGKL